MLTSTMMFLYDEQARQKNLNRLIELEKTATELNMLKLQISPHFLFNTLNNIRWLVRKKSEQSEESILKLSEILRYIIYEVGDTKVALSKEIEHLKNYIELQSLRLPIAGNVFFKVEDGINHYQIEPLLFIHFVENAFKYGIDSKNAPDIRFEFRKLPSGILFHSKNKILLKKTTVQNEGIGLVNIQRRLELLYPNKHELTINMSEGEFEVQLRLELH
ncbi:sensor histidine kinase [Runella aurantiaca]|nr:sensor histidine kinase [Runella aurantiaca]